MKNFDEWNKEKKIIQNSFLGKWCHKREIWWCSLGCNVGFEEDGKNEMKQRPVLILKMLSFNTCIIVPLTSSGKRHKYRIFAKKIDDKENFAIISQLRLIDTRRLVNKVSVVDNDIYETIQKAVKDML